MPTAAGVDVPKWCVAAGLTVITPAAAYAYILRTSRQRQEFFAHTPQPKEASVIFANLPMVAEKNHPEKAVQTVKQLFSELGLTWGLRLPHWLFSREFSLTTADPAIIAEVQSKKEIFHSRPSKILFDTTIPLGLLALRSEGPNSQWSFHRRLVAPLFSDKFLQGYSEQIQDKANLLQYILEERIKAARSVEAECDVQHCLKLATLDVIGSIGFGFDSNSMMTYLPEGHPKALSKSETANELQFFEASEAYLMETQKRSGEPTFMRYLPQRYMRWRQVKTFIARRINDVLSSGKTSRLNMLKALQDAHEGDRKMSRAELTDEILTLLLAGHETTGYTTSWALYEVARHPDVQDKILAETSAVDLDTLPMTSVEKSLPYTWMAWQEALRLHPTLTALFRQAEVDTTLGGKYNIPKGSVVQVSQLALAHSEDIWGPDVMSFSPERMAKGYPEMHFPFGFGGRVCIGKRLAYVEGVYFLAFLVKNFMLRVEEGSPAPKSRLTITHHAKEGIRLLMSKRRP